MQIEKRIPFGFRGDWGKLYKRYTFDQSTEVKQGEVITYEKNKYREIGQDVQFKRVDESSDGVEQPMQGMVNGVEYAVVETTDAYFNTNKGEYICVVSPDDIVFVLGRLWLVTGIKTVFTYTPAPQKFFYCDLKSIM